MVDRLGGRTADGCTGAACPWAWFMAARTLPRRLEFRLFTHLAEHTAPLTQIASALAFVRTGRGTVVMPVPRWGWYTLQTPHPRAFATPGSREISGRRMADVHWQLFADV